MVATTLEISEKKEFYCGECGSRDIRFQAGMFWNISKQIFVFTGHIDDEGHECNACGQQYILCQTETAKREIFYKN